MKEHRIVASNAIVTPVIIGVTPHHYFHSEKLGKCRAILIAPDENLASVAKPYATKPLSKGEQLEMLMDCGERLHQRYFLLYTQYDALTDSDWKARKALLVKMNAVNDASTRLTKKIKLLVCESR